VEDKASGRSLIQEIQHDTALPVIAVKIDTDKVACAQALTPLIESGRVFLPEGAAWLPDYMDELASFPRAVHDDMVESTTQALNYLREEPCVLAFIDYLNTEASLREHQRKTPEQTPSCCPKCDSGCIQDVQAQWRCGMCGAQSFKEANNRHLSRSSVDGMG
jgi:ribosomal protein S27AE